MNRERVEQLVRELLIERLAGDGVRVLDVYLRDGAEIAAGLRRGEEEITTRLFGLMECLKIDDSVGHKAGEYMKAYRASHSTEIADALIAATAICWPRAATPTG